MRGGAGLGEHVVGAGDDGRQGRAGRVEVGPGRAPGLRQPGLDVAERGDVEQPLEHLAAVVGGGPQERREVALGEQHHLGELRHAHAQDVLDDVGDLVVAGAERDPPALAALLEGHHRLHRHRAVAALLGPHELGRAADAQPPRAGGELERDPRHGIRGRRGRCADRAWSATRARRRRGRSRWRRAGWSCPTPVGPWMRKRPSADRASTSTTTRSGNGPNASISSRCTLMRRPPTPRPHRTRRRPPRRHRPGGRAGWPRRPRRAAPARRRWPRGRRGRAPRKSQHTSTSVAVATRAA